MSATPPDAATPAHLDPSELGTKQYWDNLYATELCNHASNPADKGTVWFDDSDAENKIVAFLDDDEAELALDRATASVLDFGCGNGSLLFALRDDGWAGRLVGVDYSERSVKLAVAVGEGRAGREEDGGGGQVEFRVWDVLRGDFAVVPSLSGAGWDLVLDKGTFDAVSLSDERDGRGRRICEGYGERVVRLLRPGGKFLVTSCNWTEKELGGWFERTNTLDGGDSAGARLKQVARIDYPSFSFGGVKGQTISTLCFEKVEA
ncbi:S-adenosyl-L-methionine-dependent methyltransferase [Lasiosphaeria hispida]|uniref:Protein-lysine N-methyltransferase EFM4 n=1 Tax=Lasiosphaeria hispida TaxID=260671 RepID=A0AAJ0HLQ3_9PEZI|nr:S-adenosyl-L-methionine-dependent methyltransferase [Lasiosphaeria hispida]